MHPGVRMRQVTHWALSAVLALGVVLVAWHSSLKNGAGGDDSPVVREAMADDRTFLDEDDPSEQRRLEILSMPACVDMVRSLQRLDDARDRLLKEGAAGSAEAAAQAVRDYQQAVQAVREGVARLRSRLTPDEYEGFWARLGAEREERCVAEFSLREAELGIVPVRSAP